MKRFILFNLIILICYVSKVYAQQRACSSTQQQWQLLNVQPHFRDLIKAQLETQQNRTAALSCDTIQVPVVVHVVYHNAEQNISDEQVQSQIDALNEDFTAINATIMEVPDVWKPLIADSKIRFTLAKRSPDTTNSNGITRTSTTVSPFYTLDSRIKYDTAGGVNAWPASSYLNIWVCNLDGALGYAQFPGVQPEEDGIVIDYRAFGRKGDLNKKYNLGRTVTHEVGHWFRLFHVWGDEDLCDNDDMIDDTPLQAKATYGSAKFPKYDICTAGGDGIMFTNYLDYTDDKDMMFFTPNQIDTMRWYFGLFRDSICYSTGGEWVSRFNSDLELEAIVSPITITELRCFTPVVHIRNNGTAAVSQFQIIYNLVNGQKRLYNWTGLLQSDSAVIISLPFISGSEGLNVLEVRIADSDSNNTNNYRSRGFKIAKENTAGCEDGNPFIYPNPVTSHSFCVKSNFNSTNEITIRVINMLGQRVFEIKEGISNPGDIFPVNMAEQAKGVYLVQLINGDESRGVKLIYLPGEGNYSSLSICN